MTKHLSQEDRRKQILEAARRCFIRMGFGDTRVDDIAREAGLSKGGIYFHFKSKREVFDALHAQEFERNMALLESAGTASGSTVERLGNLAAQVITRFSEADGHRRFLVVLGEMGIRDKEVHRKVVLSHDRYVETLTQQIRDGISRGEIREIDAAGAALVLKLLVDGIEQGFAIGLNIDQGTLLRVGMDIILHGLAPNGSREAQTNEEPPP